MADIKPKCLLPPEIFVEIIEKLVEDKENKALITLAQVSKQFRTLVLKYGHSLYECVYPDDERRWHYHPREEHHHAIDRVINTAAVCDDTETVSQILMRGVCPYTHWLGLRSALKHQNFDIASEFLKPSSKGHDQEETGMRIFEEECVELVLMYGTMKLFRQLPNVVHDPFGISEHEDYDYEDDDYDRYYPSESKLLFAPKGQILTEILRILEEKDNPITFQSRGNRDAKFFTKATGLYSICHHEGKLFRYDPNGEDGCPLCHRNKYVVVPKSKLLQDYLNYREEQHCFVILELRREVLVELWKLMSVDKKQ
jgi:hypothetical protein